MDKFKNTIKHILENVGNKPTVFYRGSDVTTNGQYRFNEGILFLAMDVTEALAFANGRDAEITKIDVYLDELKIYKPNTIFNAYDEQRVMKTAKAKGFQAFYVSDNPSGISSLDNKKGVVYKNIALIEGTNAEHHITTSMKNVFDVIYDESGMKQIITKALKGYTVSAKKEGALFIVTIKHAGSVVMTRSLQTEFKEEAIRYGKYLTHTTKELKEYIDSV